jgi:hypothetical protein
VKLSVGRFTTSCLLFCFLYIIFCWKFSILYRCWKWQWPWSSGTTVSLETKNYAFWMYINKYALVSCLVVFLRFRSNIIYMQCEGPNAGNWAWTWSHITGTWSTFWVRASNASVSSDFASWLHAYFVKIFKCCSVYLFSVKNICIFISM